MKLWNVLPVLFLLAACGVDGEPIRPGSEPTVPQSTSEDDLTSQEVTQTETDVSTSSLISIGSSGINAGVATTLQRGNVSISLGTFF